MAIHLIGNTRDCEPWQCCRQSPLKMCQPLPYLRRLIAQWRERNLILSDPQANNENHYKAIK